jgi:hypothetical protein
MQLTRDNLASVKNYEEFFVLRQALALHGGDSLYEFLLPLALTREPDGAHVIAGRALIELEPSCPQDCAAVLRTVATSNWDVSLREVPFYLVSQFGKWHVLQEVEQLTARGSLAERQRVRVEGIGYWASFPTSELAKPFHYWEWQEVIERTDA